MNTTIYYIYDALCGWCYGFSPVMKQLHENYQHEIEFRVISGGMVLGERSGPIGKVAPYIKGAYKRVEEMSGVIFGQPFLDELDKGEMVFSSDMPSRALASFKEQYPKRQVEFAHALQSAIYSKGMAPQDDATYIHLAEEMGMSDAVFFATGLRLSSAAKLAEDDYLQAQRFQANGYPTVIVEHGGNFYLIARGYTDYATLEERLKEVRSKND